MDLKKKKIQNYHRIRNYSEMDIPTFWVDLAQPRFRKGKSIEVRLIEHTPVDILLPQHPQLQ